jgi:hypothetical protein
MMVDQYLGYMKDILLYNIPNSVTLLPIFSKFFKKISIDMFSADKRKEF